MKIFDRIDFIARLIPFLLVVLVTSGCTLQNGITKTYPAAEDFDIVSMDNVKKIKIHLWAGKSSNTLTTTTEKIEIPAISQSISELTAEVWCVTGKRNGNRESAPQGCRYTTLIESAQDKENNINGVTEFFKACDDGEISPPNCRTARNRLHSYLMKIAKKNCSTYLQDFFVLKTASDGTSGFFKDILSGGAVTGAAVGSPPVAGGLALANLLVGSYDKFHHTVFMGETAPVLILAIEAAQETYRTDKDNACSEVRLEGEKSYGKCDVHKVFSFAQGYSDQCSLKAGIAVLNAAIKNKSTNELSEKTKKIADEVKIIAESAVKDAKLAEAKFSNALTLIDKDGINSSIKAVDDNQKKSADRISEIATELKELQDRIAPKPREE